MNQDAFCSGLVQRANDTLRMNMHADWALLFACSPGRKPEPCGVFLLDLTDHRLYFKLKDRLESTDSAVLEVWREMPAELARFIVQSGGIEVFSWFETSASNVFLLSERECIPVGGRDPRDILTQLYSEKISS